jgi:hypothetical protein
MSQYSRTKTEPPAALVGEAKICSDCGRRVSTNDRYCAGCGVAFAGAPARVGRSLTLPGFQYHLVQGLGWGLGLALAGGLVTLIFYGLVALLIHGVR